MQIPARLLATHRLSGLRRTGHLPCLTARSPAKAAGQPVAELAMAVAVALLSCRAQAAELQPGGIFIAGGGAAIHGTSNLTAGVYWPWSWRHFGSRGEWGGMTEVFVSRWNKPGSTGRGSLTQAGVIPVLRYRFGRGRSAWFVDGGIGLSYTDDIYRNGSKAFGTRFNFIDVLDVGRSFGRQRQHEVGLRLSHVSNGGVKTPNPGENFLQLRYTRQF